MICEVVSTCFVIDALADTIAAADGVDDEEARELPVRCAGDECTLAPVSASLPLPRDEPMLTPLL